MGKFYERVYQELSLYVRQAAWLNATPERAASDRSGGKAVSRLEKLRSNQGDDWEPDMPPLDAGAFLLGVLFEVGPVLSGAMGPAPLSHSELRAWMDNCGVELQPWEARALRRLSIDYLVESNTAEKADAPAPWGDVGRLFNAANLRDMVRGLARL